MTARANHHGQAHQLRIIGGKWKGRKLRFRGNAQLRPTASKTRETLFNWLRPEIVDSQCLDLFAGSGILAIEALSQGAAHATMVERHRATQNELNELIRTLDIEPCCTLIRQPAERYLQQPLLETNAGWDIVFLDPPFKQPKLLRQCLALITSRGLCREAFYIETGDQPQIMTLAEEFSLTLERQTRCGDAWGALLRP